MSTKFYRQIKGACKTYLPVSLFQHLVIVAGTLISSLSPGSQTTVNPHPMEGASLKRGRSEAATSRRVLQGWVRMVIKAMMIIGQAIEHRLFGYLKMPKPRGVLARQILEMATWMETDQLDRLVGQMGELLQERALQAAAVTTDSEWSQVTVPSPSRPPSEIPCTHSRGDSSSEVSLRRLSHDLHFQDSSESGSTVLEMSQGSGQTMQFLPMDRSTTSSSPRRATSEPGVHQEEGPRRVPTPDHHQSRIERLHRSDHLQALWQGTTQGEEEQASSNASDSTGINSSAIPLSSSSTKPDNRGDGVREVARCKGQDPEVRGGMDRVQPLARTSRAESGNIQPDRAKETKSRGAFHVSDLRPGLRRHIYGCLKRSEACWLDIHNLLCNTSEVDQEQHLETTCKVIRQSLQLQQPAMKHFAELYLLQPKQLKTVAEVCNPGRFASTTDAFGLKAGQSFDLELGWNLLEKSQQQSVKNYISTERPGLTVISPPCTLFSMLQNFELATLV